MFWQLLLVALLSLVVPNGLSYADPPRQRGLIFTCTPELAQNHANGSMPMRCSLSNGSLGAFSFYTTSLRDPGLVVFYTQFEDGFRPFRRHRWISIRGTNRPAEQRVTVRPGQTIFWEEDFAKSEVIDRTGRLEYVPLLFMKTQLYSNRKGVRINGAAGTIDVYGLDVDK